MLNNSPTEQDNNIYHSEPEKGEITVETSKIEMSTITDFSRTKSVLSANSRTIIDYVGFANFPTQVFRRCIKNGFEFTLMVVGQSGLGKSTFLNTLFMAELHDLKSDKPQEIPSTVKIQSKTFRLAENDVRLKLTVVDTPGFGDLVDNSNCWEPIVKYIDDRFADYLTEETKIERSINIDDKRVHLCLYFIAPTGHGLKQLDVAFLRSLQDRVNIVPVIAKADTLTPNELCRFKQTILDDMKKHGIQLYDFPSDSQLSQSENGVTKEKPHQNGNGSAGTAHSIYLERKRLPFAVVGSTHVKETLIGGERGAGKHRVRVREYPWGTVEVDNLAHNDFISLRDMIIRNNLIDLIEETKNVHYENYRIRNLPKNSFDNDPFTQLERETLERQREAEEARQTKERVFKEKVAAREQRLMERAQAMDAEEKENRKVLEEKRALFDKLKQEVSEFRRGGANLSASSLDSGSTGTTGAKNSPPEKQKKNKIGNLFGNNRN